MKELYPETIEALRRALSDLSYGSVEITVHDGRIVQIERREKVRLTEKAERREQNA